MNFKVKAADFIFIFPIGAAGYSLLEVLWRGYTHWTMAIAGGVCLSLVYLICGRVAVSVVKKCLFGALAITAVEFAAGCIINLLFDMQVWDYSHLPMNILGQVCLPYFFLWMLLCLPLLFLCRMLSKGIRKVEEKA